MELVFFGLVIKYELVLQYSQIVCFFSLLTILPPAPPSELKGSITRIFANNSFIIVLKVPVKYIFKYNW